MNWKPVTENPEPNYFVLILVEIHQAIFDEMGEISHWQIYDDITRAIWDGVSFKEKHIDQWSDLRNIEHDMYARKLFVKGWIYIPAFAKEIKKQVS